MAKAFTINDFFNRFPDDEACLTHLFETRFGADYRCPKCGEAGNWHRLAKMPAYTCNCGHHVHPMAGTPFENTRTPLQKWFYAMYLFTTTRNGVAAKELQRQLGVTYKTAWRIGHELRKYMGFVDGDTTLGGPGRNIVEVDKAFIGGRDSKGQDDKSIVLGMVERGGDVLTRVIARRTRRHIVPVLLEWIPEGARVATDDGRAFMPLTRYGYEHSVVRHVDNEWVRGDTHTNTIDGFWSVVKRTIRGTHIWVSKKHLQKYLWEMEFRHNLRRQPHLMFETLLQAFARP